MPLYVCNSQVGLVSDTAKARIAKDITDIHCDVTGAPPTFVHAFFFEEAPHVPMGESAVMLFGQIRSGRTDAQKAEIVQRMRESIHTHTGIALDAIAGLTADTPASWVMEGGDLLPEPGDEAEWLAAHEAKLAADKGSQ